MTLPPEVAAWWQREKARIESERASKQALIRARIDELQRSNRALYQKLHPLKGRRILDDSECAVSTFISRHGGIRIPKDLKEEFGGWNRLHRKDGYPVDEIAELAHEYGLIEEPTTNALLDGLKSGRKSARFSERRIIEEYAREQVLLQMKYDQEEPPF